MNKDPLKGLVHLEEGDLLPQRPYPEGWMERILNDPYFIGAQKGWQWTFAQPELDEIRHILLQGTRISGKSYYVFYSFFKKIGLYGEDYKGLVLRRDKTGLNSLISKAKSYCSIVFPGRWKWGEQKKTIFFDTGEILKFDQVKNMTDYGKYHGGDFAWILIDELEEYPNLEIWEVMDTVARCPQNKDIFCQLLATSNPWGLNVPLILKNFQIHDNQGYDVVHVDDYVTRHPMTGEILKESKRKKVAIYCPWWENKVAEQNDPDYTASLEAMKSSNTAKGEAWLLGLFNGNYGGMFVRNMNKKKQFITPFRLPRGHFFVFRSYDFGWSSPFSVGWWAQALCDGLVIDNDGVERFYRRGDLFRIFEWYGADKSKVNTGLKMPTEEFAIKVVQKDHKIIELFDADEVIPGPAGIDIWDGSKNREGESTASIQKEYHCEWERGTQGPHTRKNKWQAINNYLYQSLKDERDAPGMFIFNLCEDWWEQMSNIYVDEKDPDDIDTTQEDHIADETGQAIDFVYSGSQPQEFYVPDMY